MLTSCEKNEAKIIANDDFNWTVTIPKNFRELSESEWEKVENKGIDVFEDIYGKEAESKATLLFAYKKGDFQSFQSYYKIHDLETDEDYSKSNHELNKLMYKVFEEMVPNGKLDSIASVAIINGLEFNRFDINIDFPDGMKMTTVDFSRLFNDKDVTINIVYTNENIGKKLIEDILNSKFE